MPCTATSKLFLPLACTFLITENWVLCLFCISPRRESKLQDVRYGRMILKLLRKAKELISLSLHLLPCSWWLFLPEERLLRPCWENESSGLLVSDGSVLLRSSLTEQRGRTGTELFLSQKVKPSDFCLVRVTLAVVWWRQGCVGNLALFGSWNTKQGLSGHGVRFCPAVFVPIVFQARILTFSLETSTVGYFSSISVGFCLWLAEKRGFGKEGFWLKPA